MANLIEQYRQTFPEFKKADDTQIVDALWERFGGKDSGVDKEDFALELKGRGPRIGAFKAGLEDMKSSMDTGIGRLLYAAGAEETGKAMYQRAKERSEDTEERFKPSVASYEDITGPASAAQYLYEGVARSVPNMIPMVGGRLAGAGIGALVGGPGGAAVGANLGTFLPQIPQFIGSNIERQIDEGRNFEDTNLTGASTAAGAQAALSSLSFGVLARSFPGLVMKGGTSRLRSAALAGIESGASEALTEPAQQALEIMQASPEKFFEFGPAVQKELINAAILGGGSGFLLGAAGGAAFPGGKKDKVVSPKDFGPSAEKPDTQTDEDTKAAEETPATEDAAPPPDGPPPPDESVAVPVNEDLAPAPKTPSTDLGPVAPVSVEPTTGEGIAAPGVSVYPTEIVDPTTSPTGVDPTTEPSPVVQPAPVAAPTQGVEPAPIDIPPVKPVTVDEIPPAATPPVDVSPIAPPAAPVEAPKVPGVTAASLFDAPNPPALPKPLKLGSPKFSQLYLNFERDIDRALFQASKDTLKPKDLQYRDWLKEQGFTDGEITAYGQQYRQILREAYRERGKSGQPIGNWTPPQFTMKLRPSEAAPVATPPAAAPAMGAVPFTESVSKREDVKAGADRLLTTEAPGQAKSVIKVAALGLNKLESRLPGSVEILRELAARLYPGVKINLNVQDIANNVGGSIGNVWGYSKGGGEFTMTLNVGSSTKKLYANSSSVNQKTDILHTLFHELSHPLEHFHLQNSSQQTIDAVVQQYLDEVNPVAAQRAAVYSVLSERFSETDPDFVKKLADRLNLTPQIIDNYVKSKGKKLPADFPRGNQLSTEMRDDYNRSFTEWVAEKGAAWLRKEAEGLVPKTAFEKFQKEVLDRMRALYAGIQKMLGIKPSEGAFEKFMAETYGKKDMTPSAKGRVSRPDIIEYPKNGGYAQGNMETLASQTNVSEDVPETVRAAEAKLADQYVPPKKRGFKGFMESVKEAYKNGDYKDLGDKITRLVSDRFIDLKRLDERYANFLKTTGKAFAGAYDDRYAIAANLSSYNSILARENVLGMLESLLQHGGVPVIARQGNFVTDGYLKIETGPGKNGLQFLLPLIQQNKLDGFKYYAMAQRVLGRYANLKAPITQAEAQEIVNHYGKDKTITDAYKQYQDFNKALMKMAVDSGVISQDIANEFMKHNDYYPFYREMDESGKYTGPLFTSGALTRTKIQQAIGGVEKLDADPIDVIMKNAQFWMHSAAKNLASSKITTMMEALGEAREINNSSKLRPGEGLGIVRVDGKEKMYALNNPDIVAALETTGAHQLPNWTGVPGTFTRFYRELVTRSPDFILKNIIRDPLAAMVTSGVSINPAQAMGNLVRALTDKNNENLRAIQNFGLIGGFRDIPGTEDATRILNKDFKPTSNGIYVVPNGNVMTQILSKAWNNLGKLAEASDAATRMEIYKKVLEATGNEAEAAFRAQEYMNFRKQGSSSLIRYASILVPFINGRIQGLDVTVRAFHKDNLKYTVTKGLYLTGVAMALQAMFGDDEEYKQLPDYVRYGTTPIPLKALGLGDTGFLAVPKPFEIGFIFQTMPEVIAQWASGNTENREIPKVAWEQLKNTFGVSPFPQIVSPLFEVALNRSNLTGLPVVSDAMKNLPPELQYSSSTSDIVKAVAGSAGISPVKAEALIKGYGGQIGTMILGVVDGMYRSATGTGVDKDWTQYPTVSTFLKTQANTNPKGASDVYRLSAEIQGITTAINTYMAQGMAERAVELMKDNQDLLAMKGAVTALRSQLNTLSRNERMIVNNPHIPQDQKEAQFDMLRDARRQVGKVMTSMISMTGK